MLIMWALLLHSDRYTAASRDLEEVSTDDGQSVGVVRDAAQMSVGRQHTAEDLQEELQWKLVQEVDLQQHSRRMQLSQQTRSELHCSKVQTYHLLC